MLPTTDAQRRALLALESRLAVHLRSIEAWTRLAKRRMVLSLAVRLQLGLKDYRVCELIGSRREAYRLGDEM